MFRSFFIGLSQSASVRRMVTNWSLAWKMAGRFVAGEKLEDAIQAIQMLNSKGIFATLDHLGEHTDSMDAAVRASQDILQALDAVDRTGVQANVSIKLTQLGLNIDPGLCSENLRSILSYAQDRGNFIRIDMEDSSVTQVTLDIVLHMNAEGFRNVGVVIQSYLYRSRQDLQDLVAAKIPIRLCKGAYKESPERAYPMKRDVDCAYDNLCDVLLAAEKPIKPGENRESGKFPPLAAFATHDEARIAFACRTALEKEIENNRLEFQMLYGIRRDLQQRLVDSGYPVRVYVPYGTEWYPYFMRRLAERPANVWFFISNLLKR